MSATLKKFFFSQAQRKRANRVDAFEVAQNELSHLDLYCLLVANSVDPDKAADNESAHLHICFLQIQLFVFVCSALAKFLDYNRRKKVQLLSSEICFSISTVYKLVPAISTGILSKSNACCQRFIV